LNDILDISRIEAGAMSIGAEAFDLGLLARDVGGLFSARAQGGGVGFSVVVEPEADCEVTGDELRVRPILNNLDSNAIKYTEAGSVKVHVRQEGEEFVLEVTDTGVGIAPDQLERIFDAFVQADDSSTRRFGGSGLGLSIVRRLAEAMGGTVTATSRQGVGSVFTARLPLPAAPARQPGPEAAAPEPAPASETRPCRVLVVEDNLTNQRVIEAILGSAGADITLAENGLEAVSAWEAEDFDLILMDITMPVMDGVQAATAIRERERASGRARTPIVAVTANVMPEQLDNYRVVGMDGHVAKPLDCNRLIQAVRDATEAESESGAARASA
jgi:CheY-like chemotaxis protein/anti-sigma regulatory factor (Ser/Thr protein kinase)